MTEQRQRQITDEFDRATVFLFSRVQGLSDFDSVVCVEHLRFIPCRSCMYGTPAAIPYSSDAQDVEFVESYQNRRS